MKKLLTFKTLAIVLVITSVILMLYVAAVPWRVERLFS